MITFLIPTFNEKENILILINKINKLKLKFEYNFLFVDDNSKDGTKEELIKAKNQFDNVNFIIRDKKNRDLTQSILLGFSVLNNKYTFILDCDLQHDYKKIQFIFDTALKEKLDLVIGSRFVKDGQNISMSKRRKLESRTAIMLCRFLGIQNINDPLSGFFLIKTDLLTKLKNKIKTRGFKILLTILFFCKNEISFKEVPIKFNIRKYGYSKFNLKVRLLFIEQVIKLKFKL